MLIRTLSTLVLSMALVAGCSAGSDIEQERISVVSVDEAGGLVLQFNSEDLSFRLIAKAEGEMARSWIQLSDGTVVGDVSVPRDQVPAAPPMLLSAIEEVAGRSDIVNAAELRMAVEEMVQFVATTSHPQRALLQQNLDLVMPQIMVLTAAEEGMSFSPVCPEFLANPDKHVYHTIDDHFAAMTPAQREQYESMRRTKFWHILCLAHDVACLTCGAGTLYPALCGPDCTVSTDCLGRCGGGCG